jgi:hypothetical protein
MKHGKVESPPPEKPIPEVQNMKNPTKTRVPGAKYINEKQDSKSMLWR